MSKTREHFIALLEAHRNEAEDAYFTARPQADSLTNRAIFRAGYDRGFEKNWPLSDESSYVQNGDG